MAITSDFDILLSVDKVNKIKPLKKSGCAVCNLPSCPQNKGIEITSLPISESVSKPKEKGGKTATIPIGVKLVNDPVMEFFTPRCPDCETNSHSEYSVDHYCLCQHVWSQHNHKTHVCEYCTPSDVIPCFPHTSEGIVISGTGTTHKRIRYYLRKRGDKGHCESCNTGLTTDYELATEALIQNRIATNFGLDKNLILYEAAANFYLMLEMKVTPSESKVSPILSMVFNALTNHLSEQLCLYLELASLGEIRHGVWGERWNNHELECDFDMELLELINFVRNCNLHYNKQNYATHKLNTSRPDRMAAWSVWSMVEKEFGTSAHSMMSDLFKTELFKGCMGGSKWAHIIDIAREYREYNYTPIMFIDTCFGLKHNGNLAFDKFWNVIHIRYVLDAVQIGTPERMFFVEHFASRPIRLLHRKWRLETHGPTKSEKALA